MKNISQHVARLQRALDKFTNDLVAQHVADAIKSIPTAATKTVKVAVKQAKKAVKRVRKAAAKRASTEPQEPVSTHDVVATFLSDRDPLPLKDIAAGCDLDIEMTRQALADLRKAGKVKTQGEKRGMKYLLAG